MWYFRDIQESLLVPLFNICCDTTSKQSRLRGESTQKQKQACDRRRCNNKSLVTDCVGVLSQLYVSVHRLFVVLNVVIKCWYCRQHALSSLCWRPRSWSLRGRSFIDLRRADQTPPCGLLNGCMSYSIDHRLICVLCVFRNVLAGLQLCQWSKEVTVREPLAIWMVCSGLWHHRSLCTVEPCVSSWNNGCPTKQTVFLHPKLLPDGFS